MALHPKIDPPKSISLDEDRETSFRAFERQWTRYSLVAKLDNETDDYRAALLMYTIGEPSVRVVEASSDAKDTVAEILMILRRFCIGHKSELYHDFVFGSCNQNEGEDFDVYLSRLRELAALSNFGTMRDRMLRNRIVLGVTDVETRRKCLAVQDQTLANVIALCRSEERAQTTLRKILQESNPPAIINQLNKGGKQKAKTCGYCGATHQPGKCKAFGKTCNKCGRKNHFGAVCRSSHKASTNAIEEQDDEESGHESVDQIDNGGAKVFANLTVEGTSKPVAFQCDSGSSVNIINKRLVPRSAIIKPSLTLLKSWNHGVERTLGTAKIMVTNPKNNRRYNVLFHITENSSRTMILGLKACETMKMISIHRNNIHALCAITSMTKEAICSAYEDVFDDAIGTLPGNQKLETIPDSKPYISPVRRIPVVLHNDVKDELKSMEKKGIIEVVEHPTDWESNLVIVRKTNGSLRICTDPRALNLALRRERYMMPTIEDVIPNLTNAKVFSVLDLKSGYWHVKLDPSSTDLTTFNTPFGRFKWLRLPFGLNVSAEMFQRRLHQALSGLEGTICVADDIIVIGCGESNESAQQEHDIRLMAVLERCKMQGIKLNKEKMQLRKNSIKFLGHIVSKDGIQPDPEKITTVKKMKSPVNEKELRSFLGFVQYLAKFIPHLSDITLPLRDALKKDNWSWGQREEDAFEATKAAVTSEPVILQHYQPAKELVLQCDASDTGLGASLLQDEHPLAYCSRALTPTEGRYAVIEKEMLAIVWAMERYHQYTFGRPTIIHSDHKPLEDIMKKELKNVPKRLQRMLMRLQQYDANVIYKPGKEQHIADLLSRTAFHEEPEKADMQNSINIVADMNSITSVMNSSWGVNIAQATENDDTMKQLKSIITLGWPDNKQKVPECLHPYFSFRYELAVYNGIIYKGERAIIPPSMRSVLKQEVHSGHQGIQACLARARECIYWPGMNAEIQDMISHCEVCQRHQVSQPREPMMITDTASRPWQQISTDLFHWQDKDFLATVDHFSNFIEVDPLKSTKASEVIGKLKSHMARYGLPEQLTSDNGPQFISDEFQRFSKEWDFTHVTSSPYHPQGNGKAESAVKTAKSLMTKADDARADPQKALLAHRNTTQPGLISSPAQRFMARRTRTTLPSTQTLLKPAVKENTQVELLAKKLKSKESFDRHTRAQKILEEGSSVKIKPVTLGKKIWRQGTVEKQLDERSYLIKTETGTICRNRKDINATPKLNGDAVINVAIHPPTAETMAEQSRNLPSTDEANACPYQDVELEHIRQRCSGRKVNIPARYKE